MNKPASAMSMPHLALSHQLIADTAATSALLRGMHRRDWRLWNCGPRCASRLLWRTAASLQL